MGRRQGDDWRGLDPADRFGFLLNHFAHPEILAEVSGIPTSTLNRIFGVLRQGKHSKILHSAEVIAGMQRARHRMTDDLRRIERKAMKAQYPAPVANVGKFTKIIPHRNKVFLESVRRIVDSLWINYPVEFLPLGQIFQMVRDLFEVYFDTGQFNAFRFEYIAEASIYLEESRPIGGVKRRSWKDTGLRIQAERSDLVKLSSGIFPFVEYRGDSDAFVDDVMTEWERVKNKGAVRMTDLVFTSFDDLEKGAMQQSRSDFNSKIKRRIVSKNTPRKSKRGKRGGGKKRR